MKKMKRITALLLAAMLLLSAVLTALPVEQAYADERQELERNCRTPSSGPRNIKSRSRRCRTIKMPRWRRRCCWISAMRC